MMPRTPHPSARERGSTLVVALIFLILMSLFAISAFNSSSTNMRVVGNTQARQESTAAAQMAIEDTISSSYFSTNPSGVAVAPIQVDIDGNGTVDYKAAMSSQCFRAMTITKLPPAPKNPASGADLYAPCRTPERQGGTFVEYDTPPTGVDPESCANSEWNVRAQVDDPSTHTQVAINQGVALVTFGNQVSSYCTGK